MKLEYDHLIGRPFTDIGGLDCFALHRDFHKDNFGIEIANYARPHDWSSNKLDLIRLSYPREGFEMLSQWTTKDLRPADTLAMTIGEGAPNHLAIFLGDNQILHHLYGRLSSVEQFRDFWRNHTSFILRHPDVPDLREVHPDVDIMSLLRVRNDPSIK